jgi:hypothetical protein
LKCRFCGTEIAEKALICYRCGKATTDPVVTPPQTVPLVIAAIVLIVLALLAWFVLGMGPRSGRIGDVSQIRVGVGAGPIIKPGLRLRPQAMDLSERLGPGP